MANFDPYPTNPPGVLTTAVFAMGDARYYSRLRVPATWTDSQIQGIWHTLASYSAAKLISVQKGIYFDGSGIPSADPQIEFRAKILVSHIDGSSTQLEIPMIEPTADLNPDDLADDLIAHGYVNVVSGSGVRGIAQLTRTQERRARGK